ncbi:MAG: hypothetical protein Q4G50_05355 [Corynebacterium sp.]|uniref:hypothetical protein n=1 Tax=Corynebacterium sp. TaxID=1720 RepID=UPI0026DFEF04|nr:hypothetical protein [Corynebacterium sp.]MDO5669410.1 hypothetical protein [Corynebacterium sp.]
MSVITADRLTRIHNECLARLAELYPNARFLDDTEIILDAAAGAQASIHKLLSMLERNDEELEGEILDHFWGSLLTPIAEARNGPGSRLPLDRRRVLSTVTKVVHRIDTLPDFLDGFPFTDDLVFTYVLRENETNQMVPLSHLTEIVDLEILDAAANAKIKAYSRGLDIVREMGGVIVHGFRQTPSIALLIDDCRRNLKLNKCEHGYFVSMPTRKHVVIVPATHASMILAMVEMTAGTFQNAEEPLVPWIYHVKDGHFHELVGYEGFVLNDDLLALHGPVEDWEVVEGYWGNFYADDLEEAAAR